MEPFKTFFNRQNAKKAVEAPGKLFNYLNARGLDFEDYIAELFDKGLVKWGRKLSSQKRLKAAEASKNIKNLLGTMGYKVVPSKMYHQDDTSPSSYHTRYQETEHAPMHKEIGLSRADFRDIAPEINIEKYLRRLFVLAHEAGHAMQYTGDEQLNRDKRLGNDLAISYMARNFDTKNMSNEEIFPIVDHLAQVFIELAAWNRAVEDLIPEELHPQMLSFAKRAYLSYMQKLPWGDYVKAPFINGALDALQYNVVESKRYRDNLIVEASSLFPVPRKLMGVSTDIKELPRHPPYGFWVDKSGNFIPTDSHRGTAIEMIKTANEWLASNGREPLDYENKSYLEAYRVLYRNGWMRVISNSGPNIYYELPPGSAPSPYQGEFLKYIQNIYSKRNIEKDTFFDAEEF